MSTVRPLAELGSAAASTDLGAKASAGLASSHTPECGRIDTTAASNPPLSGETGDSAGDAMFEFFWIVCL
jgi:hypothetical protein